MSKSILPSEPPPPYTDNPSAPNANDRSATGTPGARRPPPGPPPPLNIPTLNTLRRERVVLASASPRRRQLLAQVRSPRTSHPLQLLTMLDWPHKHRRRPLEIRRRSPALARCTQLRTRNSFRKSARCIQAGNRQRGARRPGHCHRRRHHHCRALGQDIGEAAGRGRSH